MSIKIHFRGNVCHCFQLRSQHALRTEWVGTSFAPLIPRFLLCVVGWICFGRRYDGDSQRQTFHSDFNGGGQCMERAPCM